MMATEALHTVPELFGSMVFNDRVMKERLPKDTYRALKRTMEIVKNWIQPSRRCGKRKRTGR